MSKTYKLNEKLEPEYERNRDGYSQIRATSLSVPGFPLVLTFSCIPETKSYKLEWQTTGGPLMLLRGMIKVVDENRNTALEATLAGVYLRAEYSGSVTSEGGKRFYTYAVTFTFEVELHCVAGDLRPRAELEAARLGLELAQSTFIETERKTFAKHATDSMTAQVPQDVALVIPSSQRVLWATAKALTRASPYLKELLESDFSEGSPQTSLDEALRSGTLAASDFDDSDDERDDTASISASENSDNEQIIDELQEWWPNDVDAPVAPFQLVKITQSSYTTYAAVLVWMSSHHISCAPLRSTHRAEFRSPISILQARAAALEAIQPIYSGLPSPASPKSVYRLAHLLGLDALATLALENLASQLTPKNASYELYSDVACCYPAVRDVVLAYVVEHWNEVGQSKAVGEMQDKAEQGELPVGAAKTAMMLAAKLADRQK